MIVGTAKRSKTDKINGDRCRIWGKKPYKIEKLS